MAAPEQAARARIAVKARSARRFMTWSNIAMAGDGFMRGCNDRRCRLKSSRLVIQQPAQGLRREIRSVWPRKATEPVGQIVPPSHSLVRRFRTAT